MLISRFKRILRSIFIVVSMLFVFFLGPRGYAQQTVPVDVVNQTLDTINFQIFTAGFRSDSAISNAIQQVGRQRSIILRCISDNEKQVKESTSTVGQKVIDQLSNKTPLTEEEGNLSSEISEITAATTQCKLLLDKSNKLLDRLTELEVSETRNKLLTREPHVLANIRDGLTGTPVFFQSTFQKPFHSIKGGTSLSRYQVIAAIISAVSGLIVGFLIQYKTQPLQHVSGERFTSQLKRTVVFLLKKRAILIAPIVAVLFYLYIVMGYGFTHLYFNKVLILGLIYILTLITAKASVRRYRHFIKITHKIEIPANGIYLRIVFIATLMACWILLMVFPDVPTQYNSAQSLVRNVFSTIILGALIELSFFVPRPPLIPRLANIVRVAAIGFFFLSLILDWSGYHAISQFLWRGVVLSTLALVAFYFIEKLFHDFYDGLDTRETGWQARVRNLLGVKKGESIPGLLWFRLLSVCAIWVGLIVAILRAWGTPDSTLSGLLAYARDGFLVGDSRIIPLNVVVGLLIFALLLTFFRWLKGNLSESYLSRSRMDSGAREALVTIAGYVGFVVAAIAGLSIAGFSFGNLAIIAGALSLGIGFGLQNIVNNFVSGIILLFERPIKTGDWIVTGTTEGYVKKIRVRSTEVQTFDRSDVIVPNSDLISTSVTNWTLRDDYGRIIVRVGVAYGSDVELVRDVLREIATKHSEILQNHPLMPIKVFFRGFGDSTLNFELRCFIHDIGGMLDVSSKLHFDIDKQFKLKGIEIAFPQRDLHIKEWSRPPDPDTRETQKE